MKEIWKDIEGYEGIYQISNLGNVKSFDRVVRGCYNTIALKKGRVLKKGLDKSGYHHVSLTLNGKAKTLKVHRLVAKTFILNPRNKPQVNHKNFIRTDNRVTNLEWCTLSENIKHGYHFGNITAIKEMNYMKGRKGKYHHNSKPVFQYDLEGNFIKSYNSVADAHRETGLSIGNIASVCNGRLKKTGGFIWQYKRMKNEITSSVK